MTFAGIDYLALVIAAAAGFAFGSLWYMALGKPWIAAVGKTLEELKPSAGPMVIAFAVQFVVAWMLAGAVGHLGEVTVVGSQSPPFSSGSASSRRRWS